MVGFPSLGSSIARKLLIDHCRVGMIPKEFNYITLLSVLDLSNNYFSGSVSQGLNNLTRLNKINLCDNHLSEQLPNFYQTTFLEFYACRNTFTGTIPDIPGNLLVIDLNSNMMSGRIPTVIGQSNNLVVFSLYSNHFSGPMPDEFRLLDSLEELLIDDNLLTGHLFDLFNTSHNHLSVINIANNLFSGTIPPAFFDVYTTKLSAMVAVSNCFTGSLPGKCIANLTRCNALTD
jgi:Leucine-rich repeat (LRR) protein